MTSTMQHSCRISGLRRRAASIALALAVIVLSAVVANRQAQAQTFTTLANTGGFSLVQDAEGNFYGTAFGSTPGCGALCGTVFKLDTTGTVTVLYSFTGGADGGVPRGGLVLDAAGNLYGTTLDGGVTTGICSTVVGGCGVVFKLDPSGTESVLHSFTGGADGGVPRGGLVLDTAGNLYGTTEAGGFTGGICGNTAAPSGCGVVFKLDPSGTYTVLYSFTGPPDGAAPAAGLILDAAGNLYGTTEFGGACGDFGCGTVFKLDPSGTETVLYRFTGAPDGFVPLAGLVLDAAGNLFGTTSKGGLLDCFQLSPSSPPTLQQIYCGVVFKLDTTGTETVLHSFTGPPDGSAPLAGLVLDTAGNLYGTTSEGGTVGFSGCDITFTPPPTVPPKPIGCGTIFKMDTTGTESVLYSFSGQADGGFPGAGLILDTAGDLYGTDFATVFKLNPLGPANFDLSVSLTGGGTVTGNQGIFCSSYCSVFFATGTGLTLTATAAAGFSFSGWGGDCSGKGTCNLTMKSAHLVFATFKLLPADFSLSASALTPAAVSPGASSTSALTVTAANGFSAPVALTCAVTPTPALAPTCSISPSSVMPGTPATLTVHTTAPTAGVMPSSRGSGPFYALFLPLIGLLATGVRLGSGQKGRKGKLTLAALVCMLFAGLVFQVACGGGNNNGGGGSSGTPAGTYTITVTGAYATGSPVHSTPTTLTVQ